MKKRIVAGYVLIGFILLLSFLWLSVSWSGTAKASPSSSAISPVSQFQTLASPEPAPAVAQDFPVRAWVLATPQNP
ncbi:MAG: hypothetical protein Q7O66_23220, partial [Dehalococcoidia bacterium]|nr:hypothetical protein [Dehalococcoidia bacterium]